mmetsp:Transcript_10412/g.46966  ORF Transcript_10412/g.46966 Transcript_10412/m.46966 type:complete len:152 (-) Transcript_10412:656-1111(-)
MSTETDELRRLETCAAGSYEIGELVARGGFASVRACRRADRAEPLVVKVTSLGRGADGGGGISVAAARRVAAEVRALLALDGTGGVVPSGDDDDDDASITRCRPTSPRRTPRARAYTPSHHPPRAAPTDRTSRTSSSQPPPRPGTDRSAGW